MPRILRALSLAVILSLACATSAFAQAYTSVVVFGDSLSDTGNDAQLSAAKYTVAGQVPGPATGYTNGRFTDGLDTSPAARLYQGVWIEQLAATFPAHPPVVNSLAGGTDYAYGFGTTASGTSTFSYGPGNAFSFPVENVGMQLQDYFATSPTINNKTLFVMWAGANDLINATSSSDIQAAAQRDIANVQALISAGATEIIVPNLPPLGLVPRFSGSPTASAQATAAAVGFNQILAAGLAGLAAANPNVSNLHIYQLDIFTLFETAVGPPIGFGLANVTVSSQFMTTVDPDTYLFWDNLHPTTAGHHAIALTAATLLGAPVATTTTLATTNSNLNLGASVTLTASVTGTSGTPQGTITFLDGITTLGTSYVSGSTTTATATYTTTTLTAGTHNITAVYTGTNGYTSSTSAPLSEIVTAPALSATFATSEVDITRGGSGTSILTLTPVGGLSGTATFACSTLPAHFTCSFSPATLTLTGSDAPVSTTLTIDTSASAAALLRSQQGFGSSSTLAFALLPGFGLLSLLAIRRRKRQTSPLGLFVLLAIIGLGASLGLTGCGSGNGNNASPGLYTVQAVVSVNGTAAATQSLTVLVK